MKKNLVITLLLAAGFAVPAFAAENSAAAAQAPVAARDPLAGDETGFSDPVFQDYMETSDGYLNSKNTPKLSNDFRDAPSSLSAPTLKAPFPAHPALSAAAITAPAPSRLAGAVQPAVKDEAGSPHISHYKVTFAGESGPVGSYVWPLGSTPGNYAREYAFFSISPVESDYTGLLSKLEKEVGFKFIGEKTYYSNNTKKTMIMGWAPYSGITRILKMKGVAKASVEKRSTGVPLKTKVRITLKVPFQNKPNAFVPDFIKTMTEKNDFTSENWFRLPARSADSKFSVFDVTGSLPVDMVGEISRSPFVASIEFKDSSL